MYGVAHESIFRLEVVELMIFSNSRRTKDLAATENKGLKRTEKERIMSFFMPKLEILKSQTRGRYVYFSIQFAHDIIIQGFKYDLETGKIRGPQRSGIWKNHGDLRKQKDRPAIKCSERFKTELLRQCRKRWGVMYPKLEVEA